MSSSQDESSAPDLGKDGSITPPPDESSASSVADSSSSSPSKALSERSASTPTSSSPATPFPNPRATKIAPSSPKLIPSASTIPETPAGLTLRKRKSFHSKNSNGNAKEPERLAPALLQAPPTNADTFLWRSILWLYNYSLGPMVGGIANVFICLVFDVPAKILRGFQQCAQFLRDWARHVFITKPYDLWVMCKCWLWGVFVQKPLAGFKRNWQNLIAIFPGNRLTIRVFACVVGANLICIILASYRHNLLPYCDPWRDNNVTVVSGFPLAGLVSSLLLLPCTSAGVARNSAINKLVQFNYLTNVSEALLGQNIDYERLLNLCETTKSASELMTQKQSKRIEDKGYHGVRDLQISLSRVCPFVLNLLQTRSEALDEIEEGLSVYTARVEWYRINERWRFKAEPSADLYDTLTFQWAKKAKEDDSLVAISNLTLEAVKPIASQLYEKLGDSKELLEKIGHYFVLNRYLFRAPKDIPEQHIRSFYERLGGKRHELEGYTKTIRTLQFPALDLTIDDYLVQLRQARKTLKVSLRGYETEDKVSLVDPPFSASIPHAKERHRQEFNLLEEKALLLLQNVQLEADKTENLLSKLKDFTGDKDD